MSEPVIQETPPVEETPPMIIEETPPVEETPPMIIQETPVRREPLTQLEIDEIMARLNEYESKMNLF
jgi:hypothetical protein